jgi:hypothetical protein
MPIRLADHPLRHKPNRRSEPDGNIYQQTMINRQVELKE